MIPVVITYVAVALGVAVLLGSFAVFAVWAHVARKAEAGALDALELVTSAARRHEQERVAALLNDLARAVEDAR